MPGEYITLRIVNFLLTTVFVIYYFVMYLISIDLPMPKPLNLQLPNQETRRFLGSEHCFYHRRSHSLASTLREGNQPKPVNFQADP